MNEPFCPQKPPMDFATPLLNWFSHAKRDLPFRRQKDPYAIWLSEIMAQQTQIDTLIPYFERFIQTFPNVEALATADEAAVIKCWEGLGYYSRARNLHKAAKVICEKYDGRFPQSYDEIITLPGIGPYTAGAIASIAFGERVPAVDGNVMRVVTRYTDWDTDTAAAKAKTEIGRWVMDHMPDAPGDYNEAIMELGALVCTPSSPSCLVCPLSDACLARQAGTIESRPVKTKRTRNTSLKMEVAFIRDSQHRLFLVKRPSKGLLAGLWGFPICEAEKKPGSAIAKMTEARFPGIAPGKKIGTGKHVFSHRTWEMTVYLFEWPGDKVADSTPQDSYTTDGGNLTSSASAFAAMDEIKADYALPVAFSKLLPLISD